MQPSAYFKAFAVLLSTFLCQSTSVLYPISGGKKYLLVDIRGRRIGKALYRLAEIGVEGYAPVQCQKRWGYASPNRTVQCRFLYAKPFSEGLGRVLNPQTGKWHYIDREGRLSPTGYDYAYPFSNGLAAVLLGHRIYYIDRAFRVAFPSPDPYALPFKQGLRPFLYKGLYGYIDRKGKVAIAPRFLGAKSFGHGLAPALDPKTRRWGYIDTNGTFRIPPAFEDALPFEEKATFVRKDGRYALLDQQGRLLTGFLFEEVKPCREERCPVKNKGWYFIDLEGKPASPDRYRYVRPFVGPAGLVVLPDQRWGYLKKDQTYLWLSGK